MSLLLLPSAASLDFSGEVFPFTAACFCAVSVSAAVSPFTTSPASVAAVAAVSPCRDCVGVSCCVAVLAPLPRLLRTLGWRLCAGWVGVVEPEPGVVEPRLLGVGVVRAELLVSAVTGVETVLSCEITDCCELRLGERCVLETSSVPSSCLCGTSRSVTRCCAVSARCLSAVSVSDPQLLLSLSSGPFCARRAARGDAGGARRAAHTMLWMCSQIRRNRRMFPDIRVKVMA